MSLEEKELKPEQVYRKMIDEIFVLHFDIYREVRSQCNKGILDYVLRCKKSGAWFGLEVKKNPMFSNSVLRGINWGKYVKQAEIYTTLKWKKKHEEIPEKLMIFIAPPFSKYFKEVNRKDYIIRNGKKYYSTKHDDEHEHTNSNSFIGQLSGIGEIRSFVGYKGEHVFKFIYKNKKIWDSRYGVHEINYSFYTNKL
jgi:hypothetical protein